MAQQTTQVIGAHAVEIRQGEHALGEFRGRELTATCEDAHHLVVEQAVGKTVERGRLHPVLLAIQLHERNTLQQFPRNGLGQHGARLGLLLAHDEVHLGREVASTRATHALQETRNGKGGVDLKCPLKPADVDAELQRRSGDGGLGLLLVAHELLTVSR